MKDMSDAELRRWAVQMVISNACLDTPHDTRTICKLAVELIDFVKTGLQPTEGRPIGALAH